jgi:hypothetical protein
VYNRGGGILKPGDIVGVKHVAVIHDSGQGFTCYMGPSDWSDERIAQGGDKVLEEVARAVAPYLSHLAYYGASRGPVECPECGHVFGGGG